VIEIDKVKKHGLLSIAVDAPHAGRWLTVMPCESNLILDDQSWKWAARLRLGVSVAQMANLKHCPRCGKIDAFRNDTWHYLSCIKQTGGEIIWRHHSIRDTIARHVRLACGDADIEVHNLHPVADAPQVIPDVLVYALYGNQRDLLVDVVVTRPSCPSHRAAASKAVFAAADEVVKRKIKHYEPLLAARARVRKVTDHFSAFAVETYGGLHKSAIRVIDHVTATAEQQVSLYPRSLLRKLLMDSVAINIQRGNADIMQDAM
jgi:hypothetical protein